MRVRCRYSSVSQLKVPLKLSLQPCVVLVRVAKFFGATERLVAFRAVCLADTSVDRQIGFQHRNFHRFISQTIFEFENTSADLLQHPRQSPLFFGIVSRLECYFVVAFKRVHFTKFSQP